MYDLLIYATPSLPFLPLFWHFTLPASENVPFSEARNLRTTNDNQGINAGSRRYSLPYRKPLD
jgi:hypothetical protein